MTKTEENVAMLELILCSIVEDSTGTGGVTLSFNHYTSWARWLAKQLNQRGVVIKELEPE